ncbi:hypothetical protein OE88DRAFT_933707 [Heliocybe sulcata]|uniref:Protection of telomeres protein 1 n=1 Tax=Heliocybe sulcata TaxID=5364 RepID=A0A5C3NBD3_9AGAM|nr:hypothetical protein OE88DRAFT_933707 [Heliocybe sulcata]
MNEERPLKKPRTTYSSDAADLELFCPSNLINTSDVVAGSADADIREYIQGKVLMRWAAIKRVRLSGHGRSAEIELRGRCAEQWDSFGFDIGDVLQVSLKGVKIAESKSAGTLSLVYDDGIAFKYVSRSKKVEDKGIVVNLWTSEEKLCQEGCPSPSRRMIDPDDWYSTPSTRRESAARQPIKGAAPLNVVPEEDEKLDPTECQGLDNAPELKGQAAAIPIGDLLAKSETDGASANTVSLPIAQPAAADTDEVRYVPQHRLELDSSRVGPSLTNMAPESATAEVSSEEIDTENESKKARRARLKKEKQQRQVLQATENLVSPVTPDIAVGNPVEQAMESEEIRQASATHNFKTEEPGGTPFHPEAPASEDGVSAKLEDPALTMQAGVRTSTDYYIPLSDAHQYWEFCTIGVVTSASAPEVKRTGDWMACITVLDPSNADLDSGYGFGDKDGFKINCFSKLYQEWLPRPRQGDVLLLRKVKRSIWQESSMGIGYFDKLRWAIYSPSIGEWHHGDLGEAPRVMALGGGFGAPFSPFWDMQQDELEYCIQLADWWQAMEKEKRKRMGFIQQVSMVPRYSMGGGKQHRLISDCTPDMPPAGYFNCTVEVTHVYPSEAGRPLSLWVTDYTKNKFPMPLDTSWCRPEFADYVLQIEAWDAAKELCESMQAGEYYALGNVKFRVGRSGYYEAKANDLKCVKLVPEEEAGQNNANLQALLARKQEYEDKQDPNPGFEHLTIKEIQRDRFMDCTVEVLHAVHLPEQHVSYLYVTDYTSNSSIPRQDAQWSRGLEDAVLTIRLYNAQAVMAEKLIPGCFCKIRSLQAKRSFDGHYEGRLGGEGKHIFKMHAGSSDPLLQELIRRKNDWRNREQDLLANPPVEQRKDDSAGEVAAVPLVSRPSLPLPEGYSTLEEVKTSAGCPRKFMVFARIADFYPLALDECLFLRCTRCNKKR